MGLKQDIVIVNEYTLKLASGKGSRGATPGDYVTRYMARELATETVEPIRRDNLVDYTMRYMARREATETAHDKESLKLAMSEAQGDGGVAFGYGQPSLSHDSLHGASKDIQRLFDDGKTVMKTVISFDQDYLIETGIVPEDFTVEKKGDYRGHIDQMKLRMAVMRGLERLSSSYYDDLRYVGVIQVDTEHVHVHLAMVDAGEGSLVADGTQRGKISQKGMMMLRRGIDGFLDEKQTVPHMVSAVRYEQRNVTSFVKKWAHQQMLNESLPQFLLACLPEDRKLWREGTNHRAMKKPNMLARAMVEDVVSRPDSPMAAAMANITAYATDRMVKEDLGREQWERLIAKGRADVIEKGVNAIYTLLRQLPDAMLKVRTPMLEVMSMDRGEMARLANQDAHEQDLVGFGFRLRSYGSRLEHHTQERAVWRARAQSWDNAHEAGVATEASRALRDFYVEEELYNARCAAKYRHHLAFVPPETEWQDLWDRTEAYGDKLLSLEALRADASIRGMKDLERAESLGLEIYGQPGGSLLAQGDDGRDVLDGRIAAMRVTWETKVADLKAETAAKGIVVEVAELSAQEASLADEVEQASPLANTGRRRRRAQREQGPPRPRFQAVAAPGPEFPIEEVKGLDMHHLRWDFSRDAEVGPMTMRRFRDQAERRSAALDRALDYLAASGQMEASAELPIHDVDRMVATADEVEETGFLASTVADLQRRQELVKRSRTVEMTGLLAAQIESRVSLAASQAAREPVEIEPTESAPSTSVGRAKETSAIDRG